VADDDNRRAPRLQQNITSLSSQQQTTTANDDSSSDEMNQYTALVGKRKAAAQRPLTSSVVGKNVPPVPQRAHQATTISHQRQRPSMSSAGADEVFGFLHSLANQNESSNSSAAAASAKTTIGGVTRKNKKTTNK
jgi:hypothetical protein